MAKRIGDDVLNAALTELATSVRQSICTDEPANFAGIAAVQLTAQTIDGGDFSQAAGDVSGRKTTIAQQTDVPIDATGEGDHIVYDDGTVILGITTCTPQSLTSGGTVTIPAHDFEIQAPV